MKHLAPQVLDLMEIIDQPFVLIGRDYRIVAANTRYCRTYDTTPEAVIGRYCHQVSRHRDLPCHLAGGDCPHRQVFEGGESHEVIHTYYDSCGHLERVRIHGHAVRDVNGNLLLGVILTPLPRCDGPPGQTRMIGKSRRFTRTLDELERAARCDAGVLLLGESGTGKELAANMLHTYSERANRPLITVDCTTLTEPLFESELFGHERGAFTGCTGRRSGLAQLADGGTLFFDEIGELSIPMQAKLLRLLDTGHFRRLGGQDVVQTNCRILAATNRDLAGMVDRGEFRADLYYRLACITIRLPPLRERREDIPQLAAALLDEINTRQGKACRLTQEARLRMERHDFPGNVRELRNRLRRAAAMCSDGLIGANDLDIDDDANASPHHADVSAASMTVKSLETLEAEQIGDLLKRFEGRRREVARALGVSERTLYRKLKRYHLH